MCFVDPIMRQPLLPDRETTAVSGPQNRGEAEGNNGGRGATKHTAFPRSQKISVFLSSTYKRQNMNNSPVIAWSELNLKPKLDKWNAVNV